MPENYRWHEIYLAAVCETDDARLPAQILEARSALEERLLSPIDPQELAAIENAQKTLELLRQQYEERHGHRY
jgi:hypothetical protein